jgi:hypothetical protein
MIVSHAGRDGFGLVQKLKPGLTFGHARKRLREFAGLSPSFPPADRAERRRGLDRPVAGTLGRAKGGPAEFADLALSRPQAVASPCDHLSCLDGWRPP